MDRVMMGGVHMTEQFQGLFICACLRLAAQQENAALPSDLAIATLTDFPGLALGSRAAALGYYSRECQILRLPCVEPFLDALFVAAAADAGCCSVWQHD